jgi:hypothetical protein
MKFRGACHSDSIIFDAMLIQHLGKGIEKEGLVAPHQTSFTIFEDRTKQTPCCYDDLLTFPGLQG